MSGSLNLARNQVFRMPVSRSRVYLAPAVRREQSTALDAVLCALVVTVGLFGGAVATLPQSIVTHLPIVHIALAVFVPFSTLFALTTVSPKTVMKFVVKGFLFTLLLAAVAFVVA